MCPLAFLVLSLLAWPIEQATPKNTSKILWVCPCNDTLLRFTSQTGEVRVVFKLCSIPESTTDCHRLVIDLRLQNMKTATCFYLLAQAIV